MSHKLDNAIKHASCIYLGFVGKQAVLKLMVFEKSLSLPPKHSSQVLSGSQFPCLMFRSMCF